MNVFQNKCAVAGVRVGTKTGVRVGVPHTTKNVCNVHVGADENLRTH